MSDPSMDALRKLAPCWSLAGDDQLLTLLENTHKRLISKCEEANCQLEQMATALNDANISLQNVNNQFMALSSSQFIESRVYDDDDPTEIPIVKEPQPPSIPDEVTSLKRSVQLLQEAHEIITILNSDTESDTDDDVTDRVVLKPKDMYSDRPLPYVIGSQPWKNKWHAGLIREDSDISSTSSVQDHDSEQYSQSEPEDVQTDKLQPPVLDKSISETSSSLPSEGSVHKPTPSDVASEIARRLGAAIPTKPIEREPEYEEPAKPAVQKVYRPHVPVTSTIFPDEPPPLSESDAESDIFADLHKTQPYSQPYSKTSATDDLFSFNNEEPDDGDIFSDFANKPTNSTTNPSSLFDAGPKPHMFDNKVNHVPSKHDENSYDVTPNKNTSADVEKDRGVKKPVGGISLFGNKGTESIGAAILKRNQRKSSTSGDDSGSDVPTEKQKPDLTPQAKKEKDIFDDLFARSESKNKPKNNTVIKDIASEIKHKQSKKVAEQKIKEKPVEKKVDLFSDNLFDDIDDIFTTNVVNMPSKEQEKPKSIFDDDDDLFSEITAPKTVKTEARNSNEKKGLFDSDDELFSDNIITPKNVEKSIITEKPIDIINKEKPTIVEKSTKIVENSIKTTESTKKIDSKSILDDDEEEDIFSDVKLSNNKKLDSTLMTPKDDNFNKPIAKLNDTVFKSPSLFDDDDESDIFGESSKVIKKESPSKSEKQTFSDAIEENIDNVTSNSIKNDLVKESVAKNDTKVIENTPEANKSIPEQEKSITSENSQIQETQNIIEESKEPEIPTAVKIFDQIEKHTSRIEPSSSDTNDDFSDQDFDDLPPKDNIKTDFNSNLETKNTKIDETSNIFDNTTLKEDIFVEKEKTKHTDTLFKNTEPEISTEKTENDNNNSEIPQKVIEQDIFNDIVTEPPVFEKPKEPKRSKNVNALFDDDSDDESLFFKKNDVISDEKPEDFKPADDRIFGLFVDEPPDDGFSKISDDFDDDLFSTLPKPKLPANEVLPPLPNEFEDNIQETDSIKKDILRDDLLNEIAKPTNIQNTKEIPSKTDKNDTILPSIEKESTDSDEDLFKSTKIESNVKEKAKQLDILSDDDELFSSMPPVNKSIETKKLEIDTKLSDDELFKTEEITKKKTDSKLDEDIFKKSPTKPELPDQKTTENETKLENSPRKVGKLKVGLNINVNALLPGASPKKIPKANDQTDGQILSVTETKDTIIDKVESATGIKDTKVVDNQNADSNLIKSVSFDNETNSDVSSSNIPVLDNKLSKERAKIQVKRRPSTRKARREAVRKSGIDFGDDSTDNSSSIDDPPRTRTEKPEIAKNVKENENNLDQNTVKTENVEKSDIKTTEKTKIEPEHSGIVPKIHPEVKNQTEIETPSFSKDVKSKVVYILNDEDIFNTIPVTNTESKKDLTDSSQKTKDFDSNEGISTLGKVYDIESKTGVKNDPIKQVRGKNDPIKEVGGTKDPIKEVGDKKKPKISLFGEEDDDEIFKNKNKAKTVQKSSLFDSDSDEELFGSSKRKVEKPEIKERVESKKIEIKEVKTVKGSLFGDESDDDDLFGVKSKKAEPQPQSSRSTKEPPKSPAPVFEDPLSMFGDD